jgi:hypothetical protein
LRARARRSENKTFFKQFQRKRHKKNYNLNSYHFCTTFSPKPVFSSAVEKRKHWNIQDYNFVCHSVWVWNLDSDIKGGTDLRCLKIVCWGRYLDRRGMKWWESELNCITRSFTICTLLEV